jgi:Aconitase X swivel domain
MRALAESLRGTGHRIRSAASVSTISSSWAKPIFAECCAPTGSTTTRCVRTRRSTATVRGDARYSPLHAVGLWGFRRSVDSITATSASPDCRHTSSALARSRGSASRGLVAPPPNLASFSRRSSLSGRTPPTAPDVCAVGRTYPVRAPMRFLSGTDLKARGLAPLGLIFRETNPVMVQGAVLADIPLLHRLEPDPVTAIRTGDRVRLFPDQGTSRDRSPCPCLRAWPTSPGRTDAERI